MLPVLGHAAPIGSILTGHLKHPGSEGPRRMIIQGPQETG